MKGRSYAHFTKWKKEGESQFQMNGMHSMFKLDKKNEYKFSLTNLLISQSFESWYQRGKYEKEEKGNYAR
ncbi:hypothetical protein [Caldalkalibacillus mannanilyticus]|uniref:hypothetical protein n=1 Tax=Caldalkalibacillus mannanilyticus TaxID=1418 RepID=UPI001F332337|nr:hypothetical protein [Caldalkalibacillus mannanilyticus]